MEISASHSAFPGPLTTAVQFSPEANNQQPADEARQNQKKTSSTISSDNPHPGNKPVDDAKALNQQELREIEILKARSIEVKAHERAHLAAAGSLAVSGASFSYSRGPDGKLYATSGEVGVDTSRVAGDPQATLSKAQQIRRTALAPAAPSAQDRSIAAQATAMEQQAQLELAKIKEEAPAEADKQSSSNDKSHSDPQQATTAAHSNENKLYSHEIIPGQHLDTFA